MDTKIEALSTGLCLFFTGDVANIEKFFLSLHRIQIFKKKKNYGN